MELYLFKSACCMAILYGVYLLFLERESMHGFKRFYLLGSLALSFSIPLLSQTQLVEITPNSGTTMIITNTTQEGAAVVNYNWISTVLWSIYMLGVIVFSIRFFKNLGQLLVRIQSNPKQKGKQISYVLLQKWVIPHTFFSYIFVNKKGFEHREIPRSVLVHERAHATQKHSLDILLAELLQLVFWFNPLLYLYKRSIKLNHEFLADKAVLQAGYPTANYQETLLHYSVCASSPDLANAINYSSIKKRFTVMKHTSSKKTRLVKGLFIVPVVAFLGYSFSTTNTVLINTQEPSISIEELRGTNHPTYADLARWQDTDLYQLTLDNLPIDNSTINEYHPDDLPFFSEFKTQDNAIQVNLMSNSFWQDQIGLGFVTPEQQDAIIEEVLEATTDPIKIVINGKSVTVNGKATTIHNFANAVDNATKNWEEQDYMNAMLNIQIGNVDKDFMRKLNDVYKTTKLYKASPNKYGLVPPPPPPPPAPPAPVFKLIEDNEVVEEVEIEIEEAPETEEEVEIVEVRNVSRSVGNVIVERITPDGIEQEIEVVEAPEVPLPPKNPLDAIIELAKQGAKFTLNGREISSDRAIEVAKNDTLKTIDVVKNTGQRTVVKLTY